MRNLEQMVGEFGASVELAGAMSKGDAQAIALLECWEEWASILRPELNDCEAEGQLALQNGTFDAWGKAGEIGLGDGFFKQGMNLLIFFRDCAIEKGVAPQPFGRAAGLIEKSLEGRWKVECTGSTDERRCEAEKIVGAFFDADLQTAFAALRGVLDQPAGVTGSADEGKSAVKSEPKSKLDGLTSNWVQRIYLLAAIATISVAAYTLWTPLTHFCDGIHIWMPW